MKLFKNDAVYVQKQDIAKLRFLPIPIAKEILQKTFGNTVAVIDRDNCYSFVKFTTLEEIEFFSKQDWIIDYDQVKDLTDDEIMNLFLKVKEEKRKRIQELKHYPKILQKKKLFPYSLAFYDFKMTSLRDILWCRRGYITMSFPNEKQYTKRKDTF